MTVTLGDGNRWGDAGIRFTGEESRSQRSSQGGGEGCGAGQQPLWPRHTHAAASLTLREPPPTPRLPAAQPCPAQRDFHAQNWAQWKNRSLESSPVARGPRCLDSANPEKQQAAGSPCRAGTPHTHLGSKAWVHPTHQEGPRSWGRVDTGDRTSLGERGHPSGVLW